MASFALNPVRKALVIVWSFELATSDLKRQAVRFESRFLLRFAVAQVKSDLPHAGLFLKQRGYRSEVFLPTSIPSRARSLLRGLCGALRHDALLLLLRSPSGYGFRPCRTLRKCRAWHLGAAPTRLAPPGVARASSGIQKRRNTMYLNKVILAGFLGKDATVHSGNNGNFTILELATKSSYKDKDFEEYISRTEWHKLIVFGGRAEFAAKLKKGDHILVEGELQHTEYQSKKTKTVQQSDSIRVTNIQKLDRSNKTSSDGNEAEDIPMEEEAA